MVAHYRLRPTTTMSATDAATANIRQTVDGNFSQLFMRLEYAWDADLLKGTIPQTTCKKISETKAVTLFFDYSIRLVRGMGE